MDLADAADWYPPTEPPPTESASENSWSSLLYIVREDDNFLLATDEFLLFALLLVLLLRAELAGRGGLSGEENAGDAAAVGVIFDLLLVATIYAGYAAQFMRNMCFVIQTGHVPPTGQGAIMALSLN